MTVRGDIAEARALLERAERQADFELRAHAIEEALVLLETCEPEETDRDEHTLIANIRTAHTRRLLHQFPKMASVPFDVWFSYFQILIKLRSEVEALVNFDSELRQNHERFIGLWRHDLLRALGVHNAP